MVVTVKLTGIPPHLKLEDVGERLSALFDTDEIGCFKLRDEVSGANRLIAADFRTGFDAMEAQDILDGHLFMTEGGKDYYIRAKVVKEPGRSDEDFEPLDYEAALSEFRRRQKKRVESEKKEKRKELTSADESECSSTLCRKSKKSKKAKKRKSHKRSRSRSAESSRLKSSKRRKSRDKSVSRSESDEGERSSSPSSKKRAVSSKDYERPQASSRSSERPRRTRWSSPEPPSFSATKRASAHYDYERRESCQRDSPFKVPSAHSHSKYNEKWEHDKYRDDRHDDRRTRWDDPGHSRGRSSSRYRDEHVQRERSNSREPSLLRGYTIPRKRRGDSTSSSRASEHEEGESSDNDNGTFRINITIDKKPRIKQEFYDEDRPFIVKEEKVDTTEYAGPFVFGEWVSITKEITELELEILRSEKVISSNPRFVLPIQRVIKQMKKYRTNRIHDDLLNKFILVSEAELLKRFQVIMANRKEYMYSSEIVRLYRESYPREEDEKFVENLIKAFEEGKYDDWKESDDETKKKRKRRPRKKKKIDGPIECTVIENETTAVVVKTEPGQSVMGENVVVNKEIDGSIIVIADDIPDVKVKKEPQENVMDVDETTNVVVKTEPDVIVIDSDDISDVEVKKEPEDNIIDLDEIPDVVVKRENMDVCDEIGRLNIKREPIIEDEDTISASSSEMPAGLKQHNVVNKATGQGNENIQIPPAIVKQSPVAADKEPSRQEARTSDGNKGKEPITNMETSRVTIKPDPDAIEVATQRNETKDVNRDIEQRITNPDNIIKSEPKESDNYVLCEQQVIELDALTDIVVKTEINMNNPTVALKLQNVKSIDKSEKQGNSKHNKDSKKNKDKPSGHTKPDDALTENETSKAIPPVKEELPETIEDIMKFVSFITEVNEVD